MSKRADESTTVTVVLNRDSHGLSVGDKVEVDQETADRLVANGHASTA